MAMTMAGPKGIMSDMNITPMIDVLLVLIIVFMIIQTATKSTGLDALVPHEPDKATKIEPVRTVVVQLFYNGTDRPTLKINQEPAAWETLRGRLIEIYKTRAERVLFVKADRDVPFQEVANVIDIAHGEFRDIKIGLITG